MGLLGLGSDVLAEPYLRLDAQGRGIGTLMRQMILVLAFDHLGALRAESSAAVDNEASLAVSRHCGYRLDGVQVAMNGEHRIELQRVAVTPDSFVRPQVEVTVRGLTPALKRQLAVGHGGLASSRSRDRPRVSRW